MLFVAIASLLYLIFDSISLDKELRPVIPQEPPKSLDVELLQFQVNVLTAQLENYRKLTTEPDWNELTEKLKAQLENYRKLTTEPDWEVLMENYRKLMPEPHWNELTEKFKAAVKASIKKDDNE
jgi:hypothetical protein